MRILGASVGLRDRLRVILGRTDPPRAAQAEARAAGPRIEEVRREPPTTMPRVPVVIPTPHAWADVAGRAVEVRVAGVAPVGLPRVFSVEELADERPDGPVVLYAADPLDAAAAAERLASLGRVVGWVTDPASRAEVPCDR